MIEYNYKTDFEIQLRFINGFKENMTDVVAFNSSNKSLKFYTTNSDTGYLIELTDGLLGDAYDEDMKILKIKLREHGLEPGDLRCEVNADGIFSDGTAKRHVCTNVNTDIRLTRGTNYDELMPVELTIQLPRVI